MHERGLLLCAVPILPMHVQSKRLSVRNSMNIDHPEPTRKPKLQPISIARQTLAVLMMRSQLQLKQRKSNCILLFFLVAIVVVTYLLEPGVPKSVGGPVPPPPPHTHTHTPHTPVFSFLQCVSSVVVFRKCALRVTRS